MPKPAKRARTDDAGASGQKLASAVLSSVTCPISQALVVDPVNGGRWSNLRARSDHEVAEL